MPCLKPKDSNRIDSRPSLRSLDALAHQFAQRVHAHREVSMTRSAASASGCSRLRSARWPRAGRRRRLPAGGAGASRRSAAAAPRRRRAGTAARSAGRCCRSSRSSAGMAARSLGRLRASRPDRQPPVGRPSACAACARPGSAPGRRGCCRCSTQPRSSSMCSATLLPEPDSPLTMIRRMMAAAMAGPPRAAGDAGCQLPRDAAYGPAARRTALGRAPRDLGRVVVGELFLVLLDHAIELVGQRVDGRVHVARRWRRHGACCR